jgi:hypothetical protein
MKPPYAMWPVSTNSFWFSTRAQNVAHHARKIFSVHREFWAKLYNQATVAFESLHFALFLY